MELYAYDFSFAFMCASTNYSLLWTASSGNLHRRPISRQWYYQLFHSPKTKIYYCFLYRRRGVIRKSQISHKRDKIWDQYLFGWI